MMEFQHWTWAIKFCLNKMFFTDHFTKLTKMICEKHFTTTRSVGFRGEGKTGVLGEKPLGARTTTNNKLNQHTTPRPGIEPGPHLWEANAQPLRLLSKVPFARVSYR